MNTGRISVDVTFPITRTQRSFKSVRRVAKMLSGNGTASGGLRKNIERKAFNGIYRLGPNTVRNHRVYG